MKNMKLVGTCTGWDVSPLQGYPQHFIRLPLQIASTHLYPCVQRGMGRVKSVTHMIQPGFKPRPLNQSPVHWALGHHESPYWGTPLIISYNALIGCEYMEVVYLNWS